MVLNMTNNVIDIGNDAEDTVRQVYGYYDPTPKTTVDGLVFRTYFGLRQYYVTGGFDNRLLSLSDRKEIRHLSRQYKWEHQWDLPMRLMQALIHNLRLKPDMLEAIPVTNDVRWSRGGGLSSNEKIWLAIVTSVNTNR